MNGIASILEYHGVGTPPAQARQPFLYVRPAQFRRQLALLRLLGVRAVTVSQALQHLHEGAPGKVVAITFDDAYRDVFVHALPLLRAYGFAATCYAVTERLDAYNTWDAAALNVQKETMSGAELKAWHHAGMEVGAHTRTHPRLTECAQEQLHAEVAGSKSDLEALLNAPVTQFCYPWGEYDERVRGIVEQAGFTGAVTTRRGRVRAGDDPLALRRVPVHGNRTLAVFPFRTLTRYADRRA